MKKVLPIFAFVALFNAQSAFAQPAQVLSINEMIPVTAALVNPCIVDPKNPLNLPDVIVLTGNLHVTGNVTVFSADPEKPHVAIKLHYNAAGIHGEGFDIQVNPLPPP